MKKFFAAHWIWLLAVLASMIFIGWSCFGYITFKLYWIGDIPSTMEASKAATLWGQFGDGFGFLNSLFSLAAVIGVLTSLYMDRQSRIETSTQEHFFQMLGFLEKMVSELSWEVPLISESGETSVKTFSGIFSLKENFGSSFLHLGKFTPCPQYPELKDKTLDEVLSALPTPKNHDEYNNSEIRKTILKAATLFHQYREYMLGNYFRLLYRIIKYVDDSKLSDESKVNYITILRAMLSKYELMVLFYNSFLFETFKPFIHKYSLFDNIDLKMFDGPRILLLMEFSDQSCLDRAFKAPETYQAYGNEKSSQPKIVADKIQRYINQAPAGNTQNQALPTIPNQV